MWDEIISEIEARLNRQVSPEEAQIVWHMTRLWLLSPNEIAQILAEGA